MTKAQCPKCGTELNEEFGMITCPGCNSVVFIDFEGQAQLAAEESPAAESSDTESAPHAEPPDEAVIESFANYESMTPMAGEISMEPSADGTFHSPEPAHSVSEQPESTSEQAESAADFTPMESDSSASPETAVSQNETPPQPLDISEYANSEASQAKEGPLTYTLHIEGLDSKELRESLREALSESRFGWDSQALMASVREGKIKLNAIEPVKASVLVNRLKRLPLKIWWEQNVITDSKH